MCVCVCTVIIASQAYTNSVICYGERETHTVDERVVCGDKSWFRTTITTLLPRLRMYSVVQEREIEGMLC